MVVEFSLKEQISRFLENVTSHRIEPQEVEVHLLVLLLSLCTKKELSH